MNGMMRAASAMTLRSSRHRALLEELTESWEDVRDRGIGSRVILVQVTKGWGASAVLDAFRGLDDDPAGPVTIFVDIDSVPLVNRAIEAGALRDALMTPFVRSKMAARLGLDTAAGKVQLGLGIGGLFASGLAAAVPLLLGSLAVTAAGNAWDSSPAGQQGAVARAARAVAAVSASTPVTVIVDDADQLDLDLALSMIDNLASRYDGQVLVVAVVAPGSQLATGLRSPGRYGLLGRIQRADADPDMEYGSRAALFGELRPRLAEAVIDRVARRTRTFTEVFAVASADRLADLADESGPSALDAVDKVVDSCQAREQVSVLATVIGWAGGAVTVGQADRALHVLGAEARQADPWVIRSGGLARLSDPASPRVAEHVAALSDRTRRKLAALMLDEAISVARDADATLIGRVVARLVAHRVRADLDARGGLTDVQCLLIRGLERLGDPAAAREVAKAALAELPDDTQLVTLRRRLEISKAAVRLTQPGEDADPVIQQAVTFALANGAVLGLEARVWAAVNLLNKPGLRETALSLAREVTLELAALAGSDATAYQWRILLAFHLGKAGHPAMSQQLLASVIGRGSSDQQKAAQAVLHAISGRQADTRLQIIILEAELDATPPGADDELLHLHGTLAQDYFQLGDYRSALRHVADQFGLSLCLLGPDHYQTLHARLCHASWMGNCGHDADALQLHRELLPDLIRVLGPDHRDVLTCRNVVAYYTASCGNLEDGLRLATELLPDRIRVLGPDHLDVLATRGNIAFWTGECRDRAEGLRLFRELLPDQIRVLGPDHRDVLTCRNNIAFWTRLCGDRSEALRLFRELLPDRIRVLGPDHPDVMVARNNIATLTAELGDRPEALRMLLELLADHIRVLGPDHPQVLAIRSNIAALTD